MLNPPKYLTNGRFGPSEQFPIEVEPITEEELKKLFCSISEAKQMEKEKGFFVKIDFNQDLIERLLKGYMEVKEKVIWWEDHFKKVVEAKDFVRAKLVGGNYSLTTQLAEKERVIERMRECVEYYATSFMTDNSKARQCLEEVKNG